MRANDLSDQQLVEGCLRNEPRCEEALYARLSARMYAVCLRYARHHLEAQDLLQDGFIKVFEKLSTFRMEGSLEGWVRRIMVHTAINHYRKKAFHYERFGYEELPESPVAPLALEWLGQEELMTLVKGLPDGYRLVFNLYAIEGYDHKEIADLLGVGESTSRSQLAKARRMLQQRIGTHAVHHHAGQASDR
ncbi:MAG: RNA polymerase sigma factor [Flavobacteriales bacterium]|nr:RNA polymerase sigma factor [Flavobacteriales bacterium]